MNIEALKKELKEKQEEQNNFEIDPDGHEEEWRDFIDEEGPVRIIGLEYNAAHVLEQINPTAYSCGLNDYIDSLEIEEDKAYKELQSEIEEIEDKREDC